MFRKQQKLDPIILQSENKILKSLGKEDTHTGQAIFEEI